MAQWVRFQLGKGEYKGKRLLSSEAHAETWKQQIEMTPGVGYGLGWMLREWNGKKVIEHGGNIDGFAAQVTGQPLMGEGEDTLRVQVILAVALGSVGLPEPIVDLIDAAAAGMA